MLIYHQKKRKKHSSIPLVSPLNGIFCPASITLYPSSLSSCVFDLLIG